MLAIASNACISTFSNMSKIPAFVVYGTSTGSAKKVAEFVGNELKTLNSVGKVAVVDAEGDIPNDMFPLPDSSIRVFVNRMRAGAPHGGLMSFLSNHSQELNKQQNRNLIFSCCLAKATAANHTEQTEKEKSKEELEKYHTTIEAKSQVKFPNYFPVGGSLAYTKYWFPMRWIMKSIASKSGLPTDTSKDYEYADFDDIKKQLHSFVEGVEVEGGHASE